MCVCVCVCVVVVSFLREAFDEIQLLQQSQWDFNVKLPKVGLFRYTFRPKVGVIQVKVVHGLKLLGKDIQDACSGPRGTASRMDGRISAMKRELNNYRPADGERERERYVYIYIYVYEIRKSPCRQPCNVSSHPKRTESRKSWNLGLGEERDEIGSRQQALHFAAGCLHCLLLELCHEHPPPPAILGSCSYFAHQF